MVKVQSAQEQEVEGVDVKWWYLYFLVPQYKPDQMYWFKCDEW